MSRKRRDRIGPEDRALWRKVADSTNPLTPERPGTGPVPLPTKATAARSRKPARQTAEPQPIQPFEIGEKAGGGIKSTATPPPARRDSPVDARAMARLRRGKLRPEARIDLHGLSQAEAHPALIGFIQRAAADGLRLVLVITGKGRGDDGDGPIPERPGVLRHNVPGWLMSGPLAGAVLDVVTAHRSHGGSGAYYVYLRRRR